AGQRDSIAPGAAEARPEVRAYLDRAAARRAPGDPPHGEGLRHDRGGPEVRPREGQPGPAAVPDLAEQDDRWPHRPSARGARRAPAALAALRSSRRPPSPETPPLARVRSI